MNKLKCILSITVLLSLLVGCSESSHYYISMTTTHATDQEFVFTSNTYMYDLTSKKLKKVSSEPYESQYPLSTYDYKKNIRLSIRKKAFYFLRFILYTLNSEVKYGRYRRNQKKNCPTHC